MHKDEDQRRGLTDIDKLDTPLTTRDSLELLTQHLHTRVPNLSVSEISVPCNKISIHLMKIDYVLLDSSHEAR